MFSCIYKIKYNKKNYCQCEFFVVVIYSKYFIFINEPNKSAISRQHINFIKLFVFPVLASLPPLHSEGSIQTRTIFSCTIFVLSKSHGMNISLAWVVYVYTALYVLVFLHSFYVLKMCMYYVLCWQCGVVASGNFTPPKGHSLQPSCH